MKKRILIILALMLFAVGGYAFTKVAFAPDMDPAEDCAVATECCSKK